MTVALALALASFVAAGPVAAAQPATGGNAGQAVFSMEPAEGDSPEILKYKAALRLFSGAQAVHQLTRKCQSEAAWKGYEKRNGNTLAQVVKNFKLGGGLGKPQKTAIDAYADGQVKEALSEKNCDGILRDIGSQEWDIYSGRRFSEDYAIIKSK
ncbi:MAG: hypothetical protein LBF40_02345 [Deltaproteobacteria bacterium]|jgi:hypothetical protein|nr:hypothetical protein [Deltaproteobacteria bacterium]